MAGDANQYKPSFDSDWVVPTWSAPAVGGKGTSAPQEPRIIEVQKQDLTKELITSTLQDTNVPSTRTNSIRGANVQYKSNYPSSWTLHHKPIAPELPDAYARVPKPTRKVSRHESHHILDVRPNEEYLTKLNQSAKTPPSLLPSITNTTTTNGASIPWYKRFRKLVKREKLSQPMKSSTTNGSSSEGPFTQSKLSTDKESVHVAIVAQEKEPSFSEADQRPGAPEETSTVQSQKSSQAFSDLPAKQPTIGSSYSDPSHSISRQRSRPTS